MTAQPDLFGEYDAEQQRREDRERLRLTWRTWLRAPLRPVPWNTQDGRRKGDLSADWWQCPGCDDIYFGAYPFWTSHGFHPEHVGDVPWAWESHGGWPPHDPEPRGGDRHAGNGATPMTRGRPATPDERARMGHRLIPVADITDTMIRECRWVRSGNVEGRLIGTYPTGGQVVLTLLVGDPAVRAFVPVEAGDAVEVWREVVR